MCESMRLPLKGHTIPAKPLGSASAYTNRVLQNEAAKNAANSAAGNTSVGANAEQNLQSTNQDVDPLRTFSSPLKSPSSRNPNNQQFKPSLNGNVANPEIFPAAQPGAMNKA